MRPNYARLVDYLGHEPRSVTEVVLSDARTEELVGFPLPDAALQDLGWWRHGPRGIETNLKRAGWRVDGLRAALHGIRFSRTCDEL